ncbi:protein kinase family protein [Paenibacillus peoriae]|uniref:protein kinase family protein n=1 Tax=Paenibacillus peoriae TaxID=59893 RepID=UPI003F9C20F6
MQNIDGFLNLKINQLSAYKNEKIVLFYEFYKSIPNEKLKEIFSILHSSLNDLFSFMNSKNRPGSGGHYNAHESRSLIEIIDNVRVLQASLKDNHSFEIDQEYKDIMDFCKTFLSDSGGSAIPDELKRIKIIEDRPIFVLLDTTVIKTLKATTTIDLKQIGEGSYAKVFKYKDPFYDCDFVIKRAKQNLREDELIRFENEYNDLKVLDSPFIIKAYYYDKEKNEYTMEYANKTLEKYMNENNNKLTLDKRRILINQLLNAFEYIHSKEYLHRDISYQNILVKIYDDSSSMIKISDFGLVKRPDSKLTRQGTEVKGAINDYSDLAVVGFENYEVRHETFALIKIIYFILTGRQTNFHKEKNDIVKEFILKGISSDKNQRYSSIEQIRGKLIEDVYPAIRSMK